MGETILTLKPGTTLTEQVGQTGIGLNGHIKLAKDTQQAHILRALVQRPQSLENLIALLHARVGPLRNDHDVSLTIAEFVLDFGEYLES